MKSAIDTTMIPQQNPRPRLAIKSIRGLFAVICGCCLMITLIFSFTSYSVRKDSLQLGSNDKYIFEQNLSQQYDHTSPNISMSPHQVQKMLINLFNRGKVIEVDGKLLQVIKVIDTSASVTEAVTNTSQQPTKTSSEPHREDTLPLLLMNGEPQKCEGCLSGKNLATVQQGWICGQPRLGNKMSMIAAPYIAALHQNAEFVMIHNSSLKCEWIDWLRDIFPNIRKMRSILAKITDPWPNTGESGFTSFNPIEIHGNLTSSGFRQSWQYFPKPEDWKALQTLFTLDDKYRHPAVKRLKEAAEYFNTSEPVYIGVHMRLGDLISERNVKYGYQIADALFYQTAFTEMLKSIGEDKSQQAIFAIATDSLHDAQKILDSLTEEFKLFWLKQSEYIDFAALSMCNHSVISGGTYGYWAAILNGGTTIYPDQFAKPNSTLAVHYCSRCFFLPGWIPL